MADISKININGTSYNIAQPDISGKLDKSGGTMTGNITFTAPTEAVKEHGIYFIGNTDSASLYYLEPSLSDDGRIRITMADNDNDSVEFAWSIWNADNLGLVNPIIAHAFTMNSYTTRGRVIATGGFTGNLDGNAASATKLITSSGVELY